MTESSVETYLERAAAALAAAGIDGARREARLLLAHCLGEPTERLIAYPERLIETPAGFEAAVTRRAARVPIAQILGRREFWGLSFAVTEDTLDPRPDSETLIEAALERIADRTAPMTIADLGTGTGCLLLSLLSELPAARGIGVDRSVRALEVFQRNAQELGMPDRVLAVQADWCDALDGPFDVVISNPPYIETDALDRLSPEVARREPRLALDGGADGLRAYRRLAGALAGLLRPTGFAVLELGAEQAPDVSSECVKRDLTVAGYRSDLASRIRCLIVTGNGPEEQKKHLENSG